ncbi:MAG: DUF4250 domain-containing protein [Bacteroidales bacterium]|nr:DUF4250 domain-containing protein [Bacteroidales bacterium]
MNTLPKDPIMLLSLVNMKLRDQFDSVEELCFALDVNQEDLEKELAEAGFEYFPELNQYR